MIKLLALLFGMPRYIVEGDGGGAPAGDGTTGTAGGDSAVTTTTAGGEKGGEKTTSLRDSLEANMELAEKGDESTDLSEAARKLAAARKGAAVKVAAKAAPDAETEAKTKRATELAAMTPEDRTKAEAEDKKKADEAAASASVQAPAHWPAGVREMFARQTPEAKKFLLERHRQMEADYTRRVQAIQPVMRIKETLDEVFKPFKEEMALQGIDESQAIRQLVAAHSKLRTDPVGGLKWLAQSYGIDLKAAAEGKSADPAADSPAVAALNRELAELREWKKNFTTGQRTEQHNAALSQVTQFADEKDAQGNQKRPYFEEVAADVAGLIRAAKQVGQTLTLQDAYDRAIHANPATREKVFAAREAERRAKEEAERKAKADAAKKAGFDVRGEGSATSVATTTNTLRDSLEKAYDAQVGARV